MPFEKFTKFQKRGEPLVSILKNGQIALSRSAVILHHLEEFRAAVLYFDKARNIMGMEFGQDRKIEGARKIEVRRGVIVISAKGFLYHFGVDFSLGGRFLLERDRQTGFLVADLGKRLPAGGGRHT